LSGREVVGGWLDGMGLDGDGGSPWAKADPKGAA